LGFFLYFFLLFCLFSRERAKAIVLIGVR